jgi:hypothetical protein
MIDPLRARLDLLDDLQGWLESIVQERGANSHDWLWAGAIRHLVTVRALRELSAAAPLDACPRCGSIQGRLNPAYWFCEACRMATTSPDADAARAAAPEPHDV